MEIKEREKLLIIEDETDVREFIAFNLDLCGYDVIKASDGKEGLDIAIKERPNLVLLDLMLPEMDGYEVYRNIRKNPQMRNCPIIMLTARSEETLMVKGLELGADDYITKPFSPQVLIARIKAVLRRKGEIVSHSPSRHTLKTWELEIDKARHEVRVEGKEIFLSATEFSLLEFLVDNQGWVFSRTQIIDAIKGADYPVTARSIDVQIVGLRKKLGSHGIYIETVRGVGYKFKDKK